ncbi:small integral membrane protein 1 [Centropristis striata]|uniref:small integral membrane protein 1 n=1 Tax=Centropristis striata TaxID=184440 RepID=UPI0027DFA090|nr:small integral membrane protein 1 [Centropristis striata]
MTSQMDSNNAGSVQYDRWNEDNINMDVQASQSTVRRIYSSVCHGNSGKAVKAAGALAALVALYILGYVTGYYVHKCPNVLPPT